MESSPGSRLRYLRELLGFKGQQQDFADKVGLTQQSVSNMERDKTEPAAKSLNKIYAAFPQINLGWLVSGAGEPLDTMRDGRALTPVGMHPTILPADKELTQASEPAAPRMAITSAGTLEGHWKMIAEERAGRLLDKDREIDRLMQQLEAWQEAFRKPLASAEAAAYLTAHVNSEIGFRQGYAAKAEEPVFMRMAS